MSTRILRSCARPRRRHSPKCSAPTCNGWPRSPTAMRLARRTYRSRKPSHRASLLARKPTRCLTTRSGSTANRRPIPDGRGAGMTAAAEQRTPTTVPDASGQLSQEETLATLGNYEYGWADPDTAGEGARRGLNEEVVRDISAKKDEPEWMLEARLKALRLFERKPMPNWGADLSG